MHRPFRILLRVEIWATDTPIVAHTTRLSHKGAFIQTDAALDAGARVLLRIEFPHAIAPVEVPAVVVSAEAGEGPGAKRGVEVSFRFPTPRARQDLEGLVDALSRPEAAPAGAPPTVRVLLVEDSDMVRDVFSARVKQYFAERARPLELRLASTGEQAWQLLLGERFDLVITDHFMPGLSGAELVRRIRAHATTAELPIIGFTVGGPEVRAELEAAGADVCLDKPVVVRDIISTLERVLARGASS